MLASILYMNFKPSWRIVIAVLILAVYGAVSFIVAPDAPAGTSPHCVEGSIAAYIDRTLFAGRIYKEGVYEPEGLLSTFPAVVTAMLGNFTGEYLRLSKHSGNKKCLYMLAAAVVMTVIGLCNLVGEGWDKVIFWAAYLLLNYLILYFMYKKDIFIKV